MGVLAHRRTFGAMGTEVKGAFEAGLLADPDAIRDFGHDAAADGAMGTDRLFDLDAGGGGLRVRLGHHTAGEHAGSGNAACGQAGAAEEGAAIDRMTGQPMKGLGQVRRACGTVGFLSEHRLLQLRQRALEAREFVGLLHMGGFTVASRGIA